MTKQEALDSLRNFSKNFPLEAIKEVQANREDYIPELLEALDYVYHNAEKSYSDDDDDDDYFLHFYAMYLLAEFKEKQAFPYLVRLLRLPEDQIDFILGDSLTEDFHRLLLCTFDHENTQMLLDVIENPELYEWARLSAIRAYELLCEKGFVAREDFVSYLRTLIYDKLSLDDSYVVFTGIVGCVINSHIVDMVPDVFFLYDNDTVEVMMYGNYDDFIDWVFHDDELHGGKPEQPTYIDDTVLEMGQWDCFENERPDKSSKQFSELFDEMINETEKRIRKETISQKQKKVGRNDPCPCGSGKKYKRCCLGSHKESVSRARLEDTYDLLKMYPKDSDIFKKIYNDEEAINIDILVYKALHHRSIPAWVKRDREQERVGKIEYLKEALDLFLDKCQREQITSFSAYDERFMVHYRSYEWLSCLIDLIGEDDPPEIIEIRQMAIDIVEKFS